MENRFTVTPSTPDISPVLQGIGSLLKTNRDERVREENKEALLTAYRSNDPDKVAELMAANPELGQQAMSMLKFKDETTKKGFNQMIRSIANTSDLEAQRQMIVDRITQVNAQGGDPLQSVQLLAQLQEDPEGFTSSIPMLAAGVLKPQEYEEYKTQRGGGVDPEFKKEERKTASQDVRAFNTKTREMRSSYGKLKGLAEQAKGGDRGARNAMVVSLARLISPGIVTETEAAALGGGQNTMQAVIGALSGKGFDTEALLRQIDPYGESFDSDGLLQVGESVVASSRQPLIDMYEGSKNRAQRAGMSGVAFDTNFGKNANYDFLTSFQGAIPSEADQEDQLSPEDQADLDRLEAKFSGR